MNWGWGMGGSGGLLVGLFFLVWFIVGILLIVWLWKKINK